MMNVTTFKPRSYLSPADRVIGTSLGACARLALTYIRWFPLHSKKGALYRRFVEPELIEHLAPTIARTKFGSRFHVSGEDVIQRWIYSFGMWEPAITSFVEHRLRPGDVFVDVGANIGYYALLASRKVGNAGAVVAVEASPTIFKMLEENIRLNQAENVRLVNMAASDRAGFVNVYLAPDSNVGETTLLPSRGFPREANVQSATLPSLLTALELRSARIIKLDVEGHEAAVMDGLMPALPETRSDLELLLEVNVDELAAQGVPASLLIERLGWVGFHPYVVDNRYASGMYATRTHDLAVRRLRSPLEPGTVVDLVFSRTDTDVLHGARRTRMRAMPDWMRRGAWRAGHGGPKGVDRS